MLSLHIFLPIISDEASLVATSGLPACTTVRPLFCLSAGWGFWWIPWHGRLNGVGKSGLCVWTWPHDGTPTLPDPMEWVGWRGTWRGESRWKPYWQSPFVGWNLSQARMSSYRTQLVHTKAGEWRWKLHELFARGPTTLRKSRKSCAVNSDSFVKCKSIWTPQSSTTVRKRKAAPDVQSVADLTRLPLWKHTWGAT